MTTEPTPECPRGPQGRHDRYSDGTCAYCRSAAPTASEQATAYCQGERAAYRRVLTFLAHLPEEMAPKGTGSMDKGRGISQATREITEAVRTLALDAGLTVEDLENF